MYPFEDMTQRSTEGGESVVGDAVYEPLFILKTLTGRLRACEMLQKKKERERRKKKRQIDR